MPDNFFLYCKKTWWIACGIRNLASIKLFLFIVIFGHLFFLLAFQFPVPKEKRILSDGQELTMSLYCPEFHSSSPPQASGE